MPSVPKYILPVFFLIIFFGAIILGPLLYFVLEAITPIPFHRAMDRALLISAVAALGLFWSRISLRTFWPFRPGAWKHLLLGYFLAAVAGQAMIGFYLAGNGFTSAHLSASAIAERVLIALTASFFAPILEETIFRGFLQTELVKSLGWPAGWSIGALIYALAHFLKIPTELDHEPVHLWSGATAIGAAFSSPFHGEFRVGFFVNLLLLGLILGRAFQQSGMLWLNAGLHSGLVFILLLFTGLTKPTEPPHFPLLGGDIQANPITTVVLILLGLWLWRYYPPPPPESGNGDNAP
jgi:membrane protease YdiL (CAAX protease family)